MKSFLVLSLILFVVWIVLYSLKKDLRKEMWWSSLVILPIGLTEPLFVPSYWSPDVLLESIKPFDIESFIFVFAIGGIAAVSYEFFAKKRLVKYCTCKGKCGCFNIYALTILSFIITEVLFDINFIYDSFIAMALTSLAVSIKKPAFRKETIVGGLIFLAVYFISFKLTLFFDPLFVNQWSLQNLSGILVLGIPLEEYVFAFLFGTVWSPIYEIVKCYKHI